MYIHCIYVYVVWSCFRNAIIKHDRPQGMFMMQLIRRKEHIQCLATLTKRNTEKKLQRYS